MDQHLNQQIGNYRITNKLAEGGFGSVYLAEHLNIRDRYVAIKFMKSYLSSEQEQEYFRREAEILGQLKHKYILPLSDFGFDEGYPYLITPYAACGSLQQLLEEQSGHPMELTKALSILKQTGQALRYVHHCNVIHRDLKPENVLFDEAHNVQLADFGIATIIRTASMKSATMAGTPAYMAPEQYQGHVSAATDQYALGCLAYELLTGHKVFVAESIMQYMYKHVSEEPIPAREINPTLPLHIEEALQTALAKNPIQRHQSIEAFLRALDIHLPHETYLFRNKDFSSSSTSFSTRLLDSSTLLRPSSPPLDREEEIVTTITPNRTRPYETTKHISPTFSSAPVSTTMYVAPQTTSKAQQSTEPPLVSQRKHILRSLPIINTLFFIAGVIDLLLITSGILLGPNIGAKIGILLAIGICVCGTGLNFFVKPWIWMVAFLFLSVLVAAGYWIFVIRVNSLPTLEQWRILFGYLLLAPLPAISFGLFGPTSSAREPVDVESTKKLILILWFLGLGLALAGVVVPLSLSLGLAWMFAAGVIAVGQLVRLKQGKWLVGMGMSLAFGGISVFFFGIIYGIRGPIEQRDSWESDDSLF